MHIGTALAGRGVVLCPHEDSKIQATLLGAVAAIDSRIIFVSQRYDGIDSGRFARGKVIGQ